MKRETLVGIVALDDLLRVSPSPATSLSVWELDYLLEKITVEKVMTTDVITISEDTAIEEAGRIMADNKVSAVCRSCAATNWWASSPSRTSSTCCWSCSARVSPASA